MEFLDGCKARFRIWLGISLLSLVAMAAPAPLTIVLDLPKTLVQEISSKSVSRFDKKKVVGINNKFYLIANQAALVLAQLALDSRFKVMVTSREMTVAEMKVILKAFPHPLDSAKSITDLVQVIGQDQIVALDEKSSFLLTGANSHWGSSSIPQASILSEYLPFETTREAQEVFRLLQRENPEDSLRNSQLYPVDDYSFLLYKEKMAGALAFVNEAAELISMKSSISSAIESLSSSPFYTFARNGSYALEKNFSWLIERSLITGCELRFGSSAGPIKLSMGFCQVSMESKLEWRNTKDGGRSCFRMSPQGEVILEEDLEACATETKLVYLWLNYRNKECGAFTKDLDYLKMVTQDKCIYNIEYNFRKRELRQFSVSGEESVRWEPLDKLENYKYYDSEKRLSLRRRASYAKLLLKDPVAFGLLNERMPVGCADQLKRLYASGETLYSEALNRAARAPLEIKYYSGIQDESFFHWTTQSAKEAFEKLFHREIDDRDKAHLQTVKEGGYEEVFKYLRANPNRVQGARTPKELSLWATVLYVAEDRSSSSIYGQSLIEIKMDSKAKILTATASAWGDTIVEIEKKYPELAAVCGLKRVPVNSEAYGCGVARSSIYFVVAEDSNIDMISYYGCGASASNQYFQLLSPEKIKQVIFR